MTRNPLHMHANDTLIVDAHNGPEEWVGTRWNEYVDRCRRNRTQIGARILEIHRAPEAATTDVCDGCGGEDAHYRNDAGQMLCCTCWEDEYEVPPDPSTPIGQSRLALPPPQGGLTTVAADLPTFQDMRSDAYRLLGDVEDVLRSDLRDGTGPTRKQAAALHEARSHIALAKAALNESA